MLDSNWRTNKSAALSRKPLSNGFQRTRLRSRAEPVVELTLPMAKPSRRSQLLGGFVAVTVVLATGAMVHRHPEGLRASAWLVYAAASAFGLAGASFGQRRDGNNGASAHVSITAEKHDSPLVVTRDQGSLGGICLSIAAE